MKIKSYLQFIGKRSQMYLLVGTVTGVFQFGSELAFAFTLQSFLLSIGVLGKAAVSLPSWWPDQNQNGFYPLLITFVVLRGLLTWIHSYMISAAFEAQRDFQRHRLTNWVFTADNVNSGQVMSLFTDATIGIATITNKLQNIVILGAAGFLTLLALLKISTPTTCLGILILAAIGLSLRFFDQQIRIEGKKQISALEKINHKITSGVRNLLLIRIYGTQNQEMTSIGVDLKTAYKSLLRYQKVLYLKGAIPQTLGFLVICGLSLFSIKMQWLRGAQVITFFYLFLRLILNLSEVVKELGTVHFNAPTVKRLYSWWLEHADVSTDVTGVRGHEMVEPFSSPVGWSLRNIEFAYAGGTKSIFNQFSLDILAGKTTVIMGPSGVGKSTLISILLGFVQPQNGSVDLLDGKGDCSPLSNNRRKLIASVGYVGADSFIFEGTLLENIVYGLPFSAQEYQVKKALEQAECDFVFRLENGLNHRVTEQGQGLSAGQKQRLSLARAFLRAPQVLILDEATANLDSATEGRIIECLQNLKKNMTIVIITHKESLLRLADQTIHL